MIQLSKRVLRTFPFLFLDENVKTVEIIFAGISLEMTNKQ